MARPQKRVGKSMSPKKTEQHQQPGIEASAIRLSPEETRIVIRVAVAGKPVEGSYQHAALAELGILKRIEVTEEKDTARKIAECWVRARQALTLKDSERVHQAMHDLEKLSTDRHREETRYRYELTDLGRQISRGVNIQFGRRSQKVDGR